jgi:ABC-type nitrate/sulfonate/bicarbonate transport system ATPase subunit
MNNKYLIEISNVHRSFRTSDGSKIYALRNVTLGIQEGAFISFIGPSGCGKTTLLRLIAGLDKPQSGTLKIDGQIIEGAHFERGFIFQQPTLYPWNTIEENIAMGLKARKIYRENKYKVQEFINAVGLNGFEKVYPHQVSGGMAQRASIARAIINEPKVLLLDEPLGALDAFKRTELQKLLLEIWKKTKTTMAFVTHDVDEAIYLSQKIVIMTARPGKISKIIDVNLSSIRDRNNGDFIALRKEILKELHLASNMSEEQEYNL